MLGAAAAAEAESGVVLETQEAAEKSSYGMKDRLWDVMVRLLFSSLPSLSSLPLLPCFRLTRLAKLFFADQNVQTRNYGQTFSFGEGVEVVEGQV